MKFEVSNMPLLMNFQVSFIHSCITTYIAYVILDTCVYFLVSRQFKRTLVCLATDAAWVWTVFCVRLHVALQQFCCCAYLAANLTLYTSRSCVCLHVENKIGFCSETLSTQGAQMRFNTCVGFLLLCHPSSVTGFTTNYALFCISHRPHTLVLSTQSIWNTLSSAVCSYIMSASLWGPRKEHKISAECYLIGLPASNPSSL